MAVIADDSVSIKKILVPIDGSETSFKAANYAIYLAKMVNAQLVPISIIEDVKQGGAIGLQAKYGNVSLVEAFKNVKKQSAEEWIKKIENAAVKLGVKVKGVILDSEEKNEKKLTTEYTSENNIDLIVIGAKGGSRFKGPWIGGFTNSILHHSSIPVLVVP
jgi:nucleotide-binding universal stress UspA family protein